MMEYLLTAKEMQSYDAATIERIGIPSLVLMERAALAVYEEICTLTSECDEKRKKVLILAGCGNNGADGLALARMLAEHDTTGLCYQVEVVILGDPQNATREWKTQFEILKHFPVKTGSKPREEEYDILIDALFGVGLSREVMGEYATLIGWMNEQSGYKIAIDVPSGIHSDNGKVMGCACKVDLTVCFAFYKRGLFFYPGCEYAGKIVLKKIGIPNLVFEKQESGMFRLKGEVTQFLPKRKPDGNKATFGKVLLAAGNRNMAGAAVLAAESCYRVGAGMVKVLTKECNRVILQTALPEALLSTELPENYDWPDVLAIGPGLGTDEFALEALGSFISDSDLPLVIDADGLNLIAGDEALEEALRRKTKSGRRVILTPHVGEIARLSKKSIAEVKEKPVETAMELAEHLHCVVVSKDARTLICEGKRPICMNTTGNSGMAVAGSGDVLTGVIAGLLAQRMDAFEAGCVGAYLHGLLGEYAKGELGEWSMTAKDLVSEFSKVTMNGGTCHEFRCSGK